MIIKIINTLSPSQIGTRPDNFFIDMLCRVGQFGDGPLDQLQELVLPHLVELVHLLISLDAVGSQVSNEVLSGLLVFLRLHSLCFHLLMPVVLAFFSILRLFLLGFLRS